MLDFFLNIVAEYLMIISKIITQITNLWQNQFEQNNHSFIHRIF